MSAQAPPREVVTAMPGSAASGGAAGDGPGPRVRLTALVNGWVQGVGFRWWVSVRALELGLAGWARNLADGRVEIVAEGPRPACAQLLALLHGSTTPGRVADIAAHWSEPDEPGPASFLSM
jgi:acylphosphatase